MMNFKSILVAINHSPLTSVVFDSALNLVQQEKAKLMILHCLVDLTSIDPGFQLGRPNHPAIAFFENSKLV
jgi:hypothetical protein